MDLRSQVKIQEHASSIWGYTDPGGQEYAILGTAQGVRIYSLDDPATPKELLFIQCTPSSWRELKTAGAYAYITTEAEDGLLIVDLSHIPDSIPYKFVKDFKNEHGDSLRIITAHTLYVDEKNFIYLSGAKPIGAGFIILDPSIDPFNPIILNHNEDQYVHETHAYHDTLYAAELFQGVFSIWDIKDRTNPKRISDHETSFHFTHSVWIEKNRSILYTADEVAGALVEAWDISDPFTIKKTDEFKVKNPNAPYIIPHNVFHMDDKLYISYYTEGVRILDTKDPENLLEVAYYDTHDEHNDGFHGCWSVYPYFKSGICIASDIENGMFVLKYDGNQPAYLQADIVDKADGTPIYNASLKIDQGMRSVEEFSNIKGKIKTGFPEEDSATITVFKKGYYTQILKIKLDKSNPLFLKFELQELPKHNLTILVKDKLTQQYIPDAKMILYNTDFAINANSNANGEIVLNAVYENNWTLVIGKWSYKQYALKDFNFNSDQTLEVELENGYEDDFILDLGWKSISVDPQVSWKIGNFSEIPIPSSNFPSKDIEGDLGNNCYYTDNYNSYGTEYNLHGELRLISPPMNLNNYENIDLSYYSWAYGGFTSFKEILLQTKDSTLLLESISELLTGDFNPMSNIHVDLKNLKKDSVYFVFRLYNDSATAEMAIRLMGALDVFRLTGEKIVSVNNSNKKDSQKIISVFPNPVDNFLHINMSIHLMDKAIKIYNIYGQLLKTISPPIDSHINIDVSELNNGVYFLNAGENKTCIKFIKFSD